MRIIHTSDWHLGQHFISKSRAAEHQAFINWLITQVREQHIDAVIIAGDVFDTGTPPSYARKLYNAFVVEISKLNCQLIVLAGNHDSVSTLDESKGLLSYLNTQVIASVQEDLSEQVFVLKNAQGEAAAVLCAIPFIRPRDVLKSRAGDSSDDKQQALGEAIAQHYQAVYQLAKQKRDTFEHALPIIATGHLTTVGVKTSDSVRDIYIGTLEAFPASAFPEADYIALGHIHRPQVVAKSEHIRYSGSPIPLSFDELNRHKQVLMVDFAEGRLQNITPLSVPRFQPMQVIKGDLASIQQQLLALEDTTNHHAPSLPTWLCIEVETQDFLSDLQQRIQEMTADLNVEVLQLRRARREHAVRIEQQQQETLAELSVEEVFERRLALETTKDDTDSQHHTRIRQQFKRIVEQLKTEGRV